MRLMGALSAIEPGLRTGRHEALLRAASAIANCNDCDATAGVLVKELQQVIAFDYLHVIAFESETGTAKWQMLHVDGETQNVPQGEGLPEGSPIGWVHESQQVLVTPEWRQESRFPEYSEFLAAFKITSTCILPLTRGQ